MIDRTAKIFDLDAKQPNYYMKNICIRNRTTVNANFCDSRYENLFYRNM